MLIFRSVTVPRPAEDFMGSASGSGCQDNPQLGRHALGPHIWDVIKAFRPHIGAF